MTIEFMFNNIKSIELIYLIEETYCEEFGDNIKEEQYLGTDYCKNIMNKLQAYFSEIKNCKYQGQTERIAHEEYSIEVAGVTYSVSFTIDTFNDRTQTQLGVCILSSKNSNEYDIFCKCFKRRRSAISSTN